jgi:hypothetical protein
MGYMVVGFGNQPKIDIDTGNNEGHTTLQNPRSDLDYISTREDDR